MTLMLPLTASEEREKKQTGFLHLLGFVMFHPLYFQEIDFHSHLILWTVSALLLQMSCVSLTSLLRLEVLDSYPTFIPGIPIRSTPADEGFVLGDLPSQRLLSFLSQKENSPRLDRFRFQGCASEATCTANQITDEIRSLCRCICCSFLRF